MARTIPILTGLASSLLVYFLAAQPSASAPAGPQQQQQRQFFLQPSQSWLWSSGPSGAQLGPGSFDQTAARLRRQTEGGASSPASSAPATTRKKNRNNKKSKKRVVAECLAAHNKWRRLHGVPELQWDDKLAAFAQKRSNHIAKSDGAEFGHPADLVFGENLFWHSSLDKGCDFMVRGWYDEIDLYDFKAPTFAPATGHFTQLIWRGTTRVGCAFAQSSGPRGGLYLTCNYDPPGNFVGEFEANVPRPSRAVSAAPPPVAAVSPKPTTTTTSTTTTTGSPVATSTTTARPAGATDASGGLTKPKKKKGKKKKKKSESDKEKRKEEEEEEDKERDPKRRNKKKRKGKKKRPSTSAPPSTTAPAIPN